MIKAYWHQSANFGDCLTPYLLHKITNDEIVYSDPGKGVFCLTGSLLGKLLTDCTVCGVGACWDAPIPPSIGAKMISVRGPISARLVVEAGYPMPLIGDPGMWLPDHFHPDVPIKHDLGIICSWVDQDKVLKEYCHRNVHIISTMNPVEDVVKRMLSCKVIVSSALHGIIAAVAYGKPVLPVKFSGNMVGDGTKYKDFFESIEANISLTDLTVNRPWQSLVDDCKILPKKEFSDASLALRKQLALR